MKRSSFFLLFFPVLFLTAAFPCRPSGAGSGTGPAILQDSTDILEAVLALQRSMPPPPTQFRPGHVGPRSIEGYLEQKDDGFAIQLPRASLTPSPTIYKGLMLVSGGFGSKEFYAFDAKTGAVRWALDLDDDGPSSAVVEDDIAVFNTESCTVFACNALSGELLWSHYLGDPLMSTPSVAGGIVYTAYPARQGGPGQGYYEQNQVPGLQQLPAPDDQAPQAYAPVPDSAAAAGGLVATHVLIALELKTGSILWQKWIDGDVMSAPVVEGKELFVTTFPGTFYKFDAGSGEILAARASRATSAPVVVGGEIHMSRRADADGKQVEESISVYSQDLSPDYRPAYAKAAPYLDEKVQSASKLKVAATGYDAGNGFSAGAPAVSGWQQASLNIGQSNVSSLQAFQGSRVLNYSGKNYATMGDEIVCTDPGDGKVAWRRTLKGDLHAEGGFLATPPLSVDGKVVVADLNGDIVFYHADSGEEWRRYSTGEQIRFQPVLEDGRIYVSTVSGKVICIETGEKGLTGWPTWGANAAHTNKAANR